jgi:hypothetical protein
MSRFFLNVPGATRLARCADHAVSSMGTVLLLRTDSLRP